MFNMSEERTTQSQFLFPDHVYLVFYKNEEGGRDTYAFSDPGKALEYARREWSEVLDHVTSDLSEMEVENLYENSELNEDSNWTAKKIPCHAWCAEHSWDEVWVERLNITH